MPMLYKTLPGYQKMALNRLKRTMQEGSPTYEYSVGALAATATVEFDTDTEFPRSQKYAPLDTLTIINNDVVNIRVTLSGTRHWYVPAGVIVGIEREAFRQVRIENLDAATPSTADAIRLAMRRAPEDADSMARRGVQDWLVKSVMQNG